MRRRRPHYSGNVPAARSAMITWQETETPRMSIPHPQPEASAAALDWRHGLRTAVRDLDELARLLDLPAPALRERALADSEFPLLVPRGFVARMRRRDLDDPLLKQVLPSARERDAAPGFTGDPLGEQRHAAGGVLAKYPGRVLLIASGTCPVHCRYCFRREFPYSTQLAARGGWREALAAIERDGSAREVILSGGDPLSLSNRRLGELLAALEACAPVETVRIHTRFPVMIPERIDSGLLEALERTRLRRVVVIHANHANELDASVARALAALKPRTEMLLNQAVLLAGVNDDVDTLAALSRRLLECGVAPYYLHLLDPVSGAAHYDVDETRAIGLVGALRASLPGYLVPRLVREIPDELGKTPIG